MIIKCAALLYSFFKIGLTGFGGGYAMLSMIISESEKFSVSSAQLADLNALDMIVPGPIAINAATYVGYLHAGIWGAATATIGVSLPSFIIITLIMRFIDRYRGNCIMDGFLSGVKPAAVGLIAAAALTIASGVLVTQGASLIADLSELTKAISVFPTVVFLITAVANIRFKFNPIWLTIAAGVVGAFIS